MSLQFINTDALITAPLQQTPYPYVVIPQFLKQDVVSTLVENFPHIVHRGSIPADSVLSHKIFQDFTQELMGQVLQQLIAQKFSLDLKDKPTMLTLRGNTTDRDGAIHTDSKSKLITLLLYMNPTWNTPEGQLRILSNKKSLKNYAAEISPLAGSCVIFQVTRHCWHGHTPFNGKRLSLQLNYLRNDAALNKHLNHHRFTAWLKKYLPKFFHQNQETY